MDVVERLDSNSYDSYTLKVKSFLSYAFLIKYLVHSVDVCLKLLLFVCFLVS